MQAIILAAGKGNRISQLTEGMPKCFLDVNGTTIIDHQIGLIRGRGISDITIVTGYRNELFEERYGAQADIRLEYNPFFESTNVLGSFWFGMKHLNGDFLFMHADTYFENTILEILIEKNGEIVLPIDRKKCGEEEMKVTLDGEDRVVRISKQIPSESSHGEFIGVAKICGGAVALVKQYAEFYMKRQLFTEFFEVALQKCIDDGGLFPEIVDVAGLVWNEIDFPEDYEHLLKRLKDKT